MKQGWLAFGVFLLAPCAPAAADMIYTPVNPSFGGSPFNSNHLQQLATTQKQFKEDSSASSRSASDRFVSMLESRLYSSLASQVANAIFGEDAQPNGTIVFNDQQISFLNTGTEIQLTVTDFSNGQVTNIVVPTLVTN